MLTFTNKSLDPLRDAAARVPLDRILVETDSPYLSPHPFRGRTNEPARVALTARRLAEIRGLPLAELAGSRRKRSELFASPPTTTSDDSVVPLIPPATAICLRPSVNFTPFKLTDNLP